MRLISSTRRGSDSAAQSRRITVRPRGMPWARRSASRSGRERARPRWVRARARCAVLDEPSTSRRAQERRTADPAGRGRRRSDHIHRDRRDARSAHATSASSVQHVTRRTGSCVARTRPASTGCRRGSTRDDAVRSLERATRARLADGPTSRRVTTPMTVRRDPVTADDSIATVAWRYLTRRERRRSASTLPPVWHVGQYTTSCDSYDTRFRSLAALRARQPGLAVHGEVLAELVRDRPPSRVRSRSRPSASTSCDRGEQPLALVGLQRLQRRVRRELGAVQHVVGVAAADAGDRALVAQDRVDAAAVGRGAQPLRELVARRFGPERRRAGRRRPGRAPTSRPCARCRTRAASTARSSEKRQRTTEPFGFVFFGGCSKSTRPACERWNTTRRSGSLSNCRITYFARRPTPRERRARSSSSGGGTQSSGR